jgi:hypothetical protein
MRATALALVAVLLASGSARADSASDALQLLDRGIALFQAGDLPAAREAFVKARELVPDKANPYRWLGLVDARAGRCKEAVEELDTFIGRVPPGDPRTVEAITIRDRCKEELQPKVGTLVIESTPTGAEVLLDDLDRAPVGTTPYRNDALTVGSHLLALRKPGHRQLTKSITLGRGETIRLDLSLTPEAAPVAVTPVPAPVPAANTLTAPAPEPAPKKSNKIAIAVGVTVGVVAAAALGIGLGIGLGGGDNAGITRLPPLSGR